MLAVNLSISHSCTHSVSQSVIRSVVHDCCRAVHLSLHHSLNLAVVHSLFQAGFHSIVQALFLSLIMALSRALQHSFTPQRNSENWNNHHVVKPLTTHVIICHHIAYNSLFINRIHLSNFAPERSMDARRTEFSDASL